MLANTFLEKVRQRKDDPGLLSLAVEVAAIKEMMERKMSLIGDDAHSLALHSTSLAELCVKSEKLVTSCNRLQERLGNMMSSQQALEFASEIMTVVSEEVGDGETLERIQARLVVSLEKLETAAKLGRRETG